MYCCICQLYYLNYQYIYFLILKSCICKFCSLCVEYISISLSCYHGFTDLLPESLLWPSHILFGFRPDSAKIFWKVLSIIIPFLYFKGTTPPPTHTHTQNYKMNFLIKLTYWLHICKITTPNIVYKRWVHFWFIKFSNNLFV